jgi:hypothetical protein
MVPAATPAITIEMPSARSRSDIRGNDARILQDFGRSAFGQSSPVIEHVNAVSEIGDHLEVVLDPDHRDAELVLDAQNEAREVLAFIAVKSGGRLVQHQDGGFECEGTGKTDKLLDSEGEAGYGGVTKGLELDPFDDVLDRLAMARLLAPHRGQIQHLGHGVGANA